MKYVLAGISLAAALATNELNLGAVRKHNPSNLQSNTVSTLRDVTIWSVDNEYYLSPAENFLAGNGWKRSDAVGPGAHFRRVPGYSLLYFSFLSLFGPDAGLVALKFFQLLLFGVSVLAVHSIGKTLFGNRTSLWVTGLYGFTPFFSSYTSFTLTESISPMLTVFYLHFLVKATKTVQNRKMMNYAAASLMIGAAILTRPYMGLAGVLLPAFIYMDYRHDMGVLARNMAISGCLPVMLVAAWTLRNYTVAGEWVVLEKAYHPASVDRFKPEFRGLFRFVKSWGEDGTRFNTYQLPLWAAARMGDTGYAHIRKTVNAWPGKVIKQFGEEKLAAALRKYQEASLAQNPFITAMQPMPSAWLPVQLEAEEMFNALAADYRKANPLDAYFAAPMRYLRRMVVHSNTSHLFIFQEPFRDNFLLNGWRYLLALVHILLYAGIPVVLFLVVKRPVPFLLCAVPLMAVVFFCFFHREVEQRYMLPFLPLMIISAGNLFGLKN